VLDSCSAAFYARQWGLKPLCLHLLCLFQTYACSAIRDGLYLRSLFFSLLFHCRLLLPNPTPRSPKPTGCCAGLSLPALRARTSLQRPPAPPPPPPQLLLSSPGRVRQLRRHWAQVLEHKPCRLKHLLVLLGGHWGGVEGGGQVREFEGGGCVATRLRYPPHLGRAGLGWDPWWGR